jgi:CcmD family protein
MTLAEAVKYVAAAYAVIMVVLLAYYLLTARRVGRMERELDLLKSTVDKRETSDGSGA